MVLLIVRKIGKGFCVFILEILYCHDYMSQSSKLVIKYLRIQEKGVLLGFISQSDADWLIPVYLKQS